MFQHASQLLVVGPVDRVSLLGATKRRQSLTAIERQGCNALLHYTLMNGIVSLKRYQVKSTALSRSTHFAQHSGNALCLFELRREASKRDQALSFHIVKLLRIVR